ncbi:MAG: hypothetical protein KJZ54_14015 [Phycisphaerales bacterium]|nr:hypothetical protein [Phycisphaerales bacterium]
MKLTTAFVVVFVALASSIAVLPACEEKKPAATPAAPANADDHGHDHGPGGEHAAPTAGHGGPVIALGEQTIGTFDVKATRDEGQIVAGKDAPIDVTVTPVAGSTPTAAAVRFWIGTEDGKGSVKAKADIENPAEPNRWHTHAEIPNPLPEGSKLWVEIETDSGEVVVGSFDLKI